MTQIKSKKAKDYIMNIVEPVATPDGELVFYVEMTPLQVVEAIVIAETETEQRHAKEVQVVRDRAVGAYKAVCRTLFFGCDLERCDPSKCNGLLLFTQKLNEQ